MKTQKRRGLLATIGAVAAAATLALSGTVAANAAPTTPPPDNNNLNITKLTTPPTGPIANAGGESQPIPSDATPIGGVTFSVQLIESYELEGDTYLLDLTTNQGWLEASKLEFDPAANTTEQWTVGGDPVEVNFASTTLLGCTNANGIPMGTVACANNEVSTDTTPSFQGMSQGLYFVTETGTPAGVTSAVPFVVALPLTDPTDLNAWMQNVYVYPKNAKIDAPVKIVDDAAPYTNDAGDVVQNQQRITYTITTDIPRLPGPDAGEFAAPDGFKITDQLEDEFTVALADVIATLTDAGTVELVPTTDYTVTLTPANGIGALVSVAFTDDGLEKLGLAAAEENSDTRLEVEITVDVDRSIVSAGISTVAPLVLNNVATVYPNLASINATDGAGSQTSEPVATKWGSLPFTKTDDAATPDGLEDAEFNVYLADTGTGNLATTPLRNASVISDDEGELTITGLRASDFANDEVQTLGALDDPGDAECTVPNPNYIVYWLEETKAPEGYELLAQRIPVVVLADGSVQQVELDEDRTPAFDASTCAATLLGDGISIKNVQANAGFTLPLTGGTGTILLTIGGLAVLAIVLVVATRRRRMADVEE